MFNIWPSDHYGLGPGRFGARPIFDYCDSALLMLATAALSKGITVSLSSV